MQHWALWLSVVIDALLAVSFLYDYTKDKLNVQLAAAVTFLVITLFGAIELLN